MRTKVDWCGFRTQAGPHAVLGALRACFGGLGPRVALRERRHGWKGYESAADVLVGDMSVGLVAYGGAHQKGWLMTSITGRGCQWVDDWDRAQTALDELPEFQWKRVDLALDTCHREVTHETVLSAYHRGAFSGGGRPPKISQVLPGDPTDGRTVYIGARDQEKFVRGYEKGYELIKDFPKGEVTEIDGVPVGDMYRLELELKVKHRPLPDDLVDRRDQYFAGAYPYLQEVLAVDPEVFVQRRERGPQLELAAALAGIRHQYGATMFTALAAYKGDFMAVWDRVVGHKHNRALLEAGVLLVDHD